MDNASVRELRRNPTRNRFLIVTVEATRSSKGETARGQDGECLHETPEAGFEPAPRLPPQAAALLLSQSNSAEISLPVQTTHPHGTAPT